MSSFNVINKQFNNRYVDLESGQRYDLYIQGVFTSTFEGVMSMTLGSPSSKIAGLVKLSQQFLITLLTSRGSDIIEPTKGTEFSDLIGGNYNSKDELMIIIKESIKSAAKQVINQQTNYRPDSNDEVLKSAELLKMEILEDELHPYILITSEAGRLAKVELPGLKVSEL